MQAEDSYKTMLVFKGLLRDLLCLGLICGKFKILCKELPSSAKTWKSGHPTVRCVHIKGGVSVKCFHSNIKL